MDFSNYASNLSEFIIDRPRIKYFCHGHCHTKSNYMIGRCNILCNPRGYDNSEIETVTFEV